MTRRSSIEHQRKHHCSACEHCVADGLNLHWQQRLESGRDGHDPGNHRGALRLDVGGLPRGVAGQCPAGKSCSDRALRWPPTQPSSSGSRSGNASHAQCGCHIVTAMFSPFSVDGCTAPSIAGVEDSMSSQSSSL